MKNTNEYKKIITNEAKLDGAGEHCEGGACEMNENQPKKKSGLGSSLLGLLTLALLAFGGYMFMNQGGTENFEVQQAGGVSGCTNSCSTYFNPDATIEDGSCWGPNSDEPFDANCVPDAGTFENNPQEVLCCDSVRRIITECPTDFNGFQNYGCGIDPVTGLGGHNNEAIDPVVECCDGVRRALSDCSDTSCFADTYGDDDDNTGINTTGTNTEGNSDSAACDNLTGTSNTKYSCSGGQLRALESGGVYDNGPCTGNMSEFEVCVSTADLDGFSCVDGTVTYDTPAQCNLQVVYSCDPVEGNPNLQYCYGDFANYSSCADLNYEGVISVTGGTIVDGPDGEKFIHEDSNCEYINNTLDCSNTSPIGAYESTDTSGADDLHNFGFWVESDECNEITVNAVINGVGTVQNTDSCAETIPAINPNGANCSTTGDPVITGTDTCDDDAALNTGAATDCVYEDTTLCTDDDAQNTGDTLPCLYNGCIALACTGGLTTKPATLCKSGTNVECGSTAPVTCCDGDVRNYLNECPTDYNGDTTGCGTHTSGGIPGCMDTAARNYNSTATSEDNSCKYAGCSNDQCVNTFTTAQADSCTSNTECMPSAVCDGNVQVSVNDPITCGDAGTIDVTAANVNNAVVTIECDTGTFGTQSADMPMVMCTEELSAVYDSITAALVGTEALSVACGENSLSELNAIANTLTNNTTIAPYTALQALQGCCAMDMDMGDFTTQQASNNLMAHCNVAGDCSEWTINLTHEVTRHWYFKLYDSSNTLVGEGEGLPSTASNNYYTGNWITQPAAGTITVKLYLNADGTGSHKTLTFDAPTACTTCDDSFDTVNPNTICEGSIRTLTNDCGSTMIINGTQTGGDCQVCDDVYPDEDMTDVCIGDTTTVRNECGNTITLRGTKNCGVCTADPITETESFPIPAGATSCVVTVDYSSTTCKDCSESTTVTINPDETNAPGTSCDDLDPATLDDTVTDDCLCEGTTPDPVDCEMTAWTAYVCDETTGIKTRTRSVETPAANGGNACPVNTQTEDCAVNNYDLALRKTLAGNNPEYFMPGDTVSFNIMVFNQGDIDATGIEVTDYVPEGLTFASASSDHTVEGDNIIFSIAGTIPAGGKKNIRANFTIDEDVTTLSITNIAEISTDDGEDCDSTPDMISDNDGTVTDNNLGDGCNEGGDEDDHDIAVIELEICNGIDDNGNGDTDEGYDDMAPGMTCDDGNALTENDVYTDVCVCAGLATVVVDEYDLALTKNLATGQSSVVAPGDDATFTITITNQGDIVANTFTLVDHLPVGLTLNDADWKDLGNNDAEYVVSTPLAVGASTSIDITTTVGSDVAGELINVVEISSDDGDDVDSAVNNDNGDQSEDDEDAEPLTVVTTELCDGVDNNGNGVVDEGYEGMTPGTSCDDSDASTSNDTYNDQCICEGTKGSGGGGRSGSGGGQNYCGDGSLSLGEECDDGNYTDGDGCDRNCSIEGFCGDGVMNADGEQCDDGNIMSLDGCSATCLVEVILVCGDSAINQEWEDCDDGNTANGDGCSSTCQIEIEEDIVELIMELKKEPVAAPAPVRVLTPLALPLELPQTGVQL